MEFLAVTADALGRALTRGAPGASRVGNSKTPARGVAEVDVLLDDLVIFQGVLRRAPLASAGGAAPADFAQAVLFTNDPATLAAEQAHVYNHKHEEDLLLFDDSQQQHTGGAPEGISCRPQLPPAGLRPTTSIVPGQAYR